MESDKNIDNLFFQCTYKLLYYYFTLKLGINGKTSIHDQSILPELKLYFNFAGLVGTTSIHFMLL